MNCSYISEKISKFFHGLIFRNLKITKITKMILATINLPKGTHLKASEEKEKTKAEKRFCSKFVLNPLTAKSIILCARKRFQMLPPQTEQCLNIVWVTGAGRRQRALRT